MSELHDIAKTARDASYIMASLRSDVKDKALANVAAALKDSKDEIFATNKADLEAAEKAEGAEVADKASVNKNAAINAPLPGVITEIKVAVGDEVQAGDPVIVLEAMKMANALQAEKAGKVTAFCVKVGETVMEDDALVVIE